MSATSETATLPPAPTAERTIAAEPLAYADELLCGEVFDEIIEHFREWRDHRKEQGDHDRISESAMCKMLDVAAKYKRLQIELREPRIQREHTRELMEHERLMANVGRRGSEH